MAQHSQHIRDIADAYASTKGVQLNHHIPKAKVDPEFASKVAAEYEKMPHTPNAPDTKKAYDALIKETGDQLNHLQQHGFKFSKIQPGQDNPYKTSQDLFHDLNNNKHTWYFPTTSGFGNEPGAANDHPLLQHIKTANGETMPANDAFRIVHDIFGHAKEGFSFGPHGEENAYQHHMQMFSPEAQKALTSETRGQNSSVNFGKNAAHNRANPSQTIYADQKAGLMPDWTRQLPTSTQKSEQLFQQLGIGYEEKTRFRNYWDLLTKSKEDYNVTLTFPIQDLSKSGIVDQISQVFDSMHKTRVWAVNHGVTPHIDITNTISLMIGNQYTDSLEDLIEKTGAELTFNETSLLKNTMDSRKLVHYSTTSGLTHIDPAKMGTGIGGGGAESKYGRPSIDRSYFYIEGSEPERMVTQRAKAKYSATLGPDQHIYDLGKDPEGIYGKLKEASAGKSINPGHVTSDEYLQAVKDAGYHGFHNSESALPHAVALFHSHPVTEDTTFKKSELQLEDLEKIEQPPKKHGEFHPTKPYVAQSYPSGGLAWFYTKDAANKTDTTINQLKEPFISKFPANHQPLIRSMVDQVSKSHTRHAVPAQDKRDGPDVIRARHLAGLMQGNQNFNLQVQDPNTLTLHIHERHGENPRPSNIKFTQVFPPNADKTINKSGDKNVNSIKTNIHAEESLGRFGRDEAETLGVSGRIVGYFLKKGISLGLYPRGVLGTTNEIRPSGSGGRSGGSETTSGLLQFDPLDKSKNVREQRAKVFGTDPNAPRTSPKRTKMMQQIQGQAKKMGFNMVVAQGKRDPSGKLKAGPTKTKQPYDVFDPKAVPAEKELMADINRQKAEAKAKGVKGPNRTDPKPDWRSGQLETQPSPDAAIHELAHVALADKGQDLGAIQTAMDKDWGESQKKFGHMQQKKTSGEVQPMAAENKFRRMFGLPATKISQKVSNPDEPVERTLDTGDPRFVRGKKGKSFVDYVRASKLLTPENQKRIDMINRGELVWNKEHGWVPGKSIHAKINARERAKHGANIQPEIPMKKAEVDRSKEIPYLAGYNKEGSCIYIDKRLPKTLELKDGRKINVDKYLTEHEAVEKQLEDEKDYDYAYAHEKATAAERKIVEADGVPWNEYQNYMLGQVKKLQTLDAPVPKDIDLKPEHDSGDTKMAEKVKELQKAAKPTSVSAENLFDYGHPYGEPKEEDESQNLFEHPPEFPEGPRTLDKPFEPAPQLPKKTSYFRDKLNQTRVTSYFRSKLPKSSK